MLDKLLRLYPLRHALSVASAVFLSVMVSCYFSMSHEAWLVVAAFLASQAKRGAPLRQALIYIFIMAVLAIVVSINHSTLMAARVIDTGIGGMIGVLCAQFVFPPRIYAEFSQGVLPTIQALIEYADVFSAMLIRGSVSRDVLTNNKRQIEAALQARGGMYPEWVYAVGFNPGLRAGFRFFLIHLERVTEVFFSLNYWMGREVDAGLMAELSGEMASVMQKNTELLVVLRDFFATQTWVRQETDTDYTSDVILLEQALNRCIPASLDLLDMSVDYVAVTVLVRDLKDLRELLLQLVLALPAV